MAANPLYRVTFMQASEPSSLYNYDITLQPIPEDESADLAAGTVSKDGYERHKEIIVNVSEEVFHSLRVGMVYQMAFSSAKLPESA